VYPVHGRQSYSRDHFGQQCYKHAIRDRHMKSGSCRTYNGSRSGPYVCHLRPVLVAGSSGVCSNTVPDDLSMTISLTLMKPLADCFSHYHRIEVRLVKSGVVC